MDLKTWIDELEAAEKKARAVGLKQEPFLFGELMPRIKGLVSLLAMEEEELADAPGPEVQECLIRVTTAASLRSFLLSLIDTDSAIVPLFVALESDLSGVPEAQIEARIAEMIAAQNQPAGADHAGN